MSKRDREVNIQAWFDPDDPYEKSVVDAFSFLRKKHAMTVKRALAESILFAAQSEGFAPGAPSPSTPNDQLMGMLERLMSMLQNGSFVPANEAARRALDEDTVQFDAISESVGHRYHPMSFEDED